MSLEITGKLHHIYDTQQIKETFSKREFILELTDESPSGMVYTNYASFQLVNNNCSVIDQFHPGDILKVSFNIRGNRWEKPDGDVKYITNLNVWRVERGEDAQQANPSPGGFASGTQQGSSSSQSTENSGGNNQQSEGNDESTDDDLPF